jgi:hypothetical protein
LAVCALFEQSGDPEIDHCVENASIGAPFASDSLSHSAHAHDQREEFPPVPSAQNIVLISAIGLLVVVAGLAYWLI